MAVHAGAPCALLPPRQPRAAPQTPRASTSMNAGPRCALPPPRPLRVASLRRARRAVWLGREARTTTTGALADDGTGVDLEGYSSVSLKTVDEMLLKLAATRREKEEELRGVEALISAGQKRRDQLASQSSDMVGSSSNDYSFKTRTTGVYLDNDSDKLSTPDNIFVLAARNFWTEWKALRRFINDSRRISRGVGNSALVDPVVEEYGSVCSDDDELCVVSDETIRQRELLKLLTLDSAAVWERERAREEPKGPIWVKVPYFTLCYLLDALFADDEPIPRFFFLETVARMPYFSYISMYHLYESLGWWRRGAHVKQIHVAEEWNEFHHLLIMESLGGDLAWRTRFMAQHAAIAYYWVLILLWALSPTAAYYFSELLEGHAVDTYGQFCDQNEKLLKQLPAPRVARLYYQSSDLYMFDEFQTSLPKGTRRPVINTLYDTFSNIRDDEGEHVKTMTACKDDDALVLSPNTARATVVAAASTVLVTSYLLKEMLPDDIPVVDALADFLPFL